MPRVRIRSEIARYDIRSRIKIIKPKITTTMMYSFPICQPSHSLGRCASKKLYEIIYNIFITLIKASNSVLPIAFVKIKEQHTFHILKYGLQYIYFTLPHLLRLKYSAYNRSHTILPFIAFTTASDLE